MHRKGVRDMISEYNVNYSTIKHILAQYYLFGRIEGRKFKYRGAFGTDHLLNA